MKKLFILAAALLLSASLSAQMKISGTIRTADGKPISGVVVSDGFSCGVTNAKGQYKISTASDAYYVFYSIPSACRVPLKEGQPDFYKKLDKKVKKYDFTLEALPNGAEKEFMLFCIADPQAQNNRHLNRFKSESVPDLRAHADEQKLPVYGVTLGDIAYTEGKVDATKFLPLMREAMSVDNLHFPVFQTIGNHDNAKAPVEVSEGCSTFNIAYQRPYEEFMGPVNYSWNRGDVHIVHMKNVQYLSAEKSNKYEAAFTDEQMQWLREDLSHVSRDKMVVFCVHVGMYNRQTPNLENARQLLKEFKEAHIMVGHTHFMNHSINKLGIYEHVHAATSGAFWFSTVNGDGAPNGYGVYRIEGTKIADSYFKGVGHSRDYQIRMYRGDGEFGGEYEPFKFQYAADEVLANVFNADPLWKVEMYEDGVKTADMQRIKPLKEEVTPMPNGSRDWWACGFHLGVIGRSYGKVTTGQSLWKGGGRTGYLTPCNHLYKATLRNPEAKEVKIVATDTFGNVYTQTRFTESGDYSEMGDVLEQYKTVPNK